MPSGVELTVRSANEGDFLVEFPDEGVTMGVPVTSVGKDLYRLDAVPLAESVGYLDVVEAFWVDGGDGRRLRVTRVANRSGWRTFDFLRPGYSWINGDRGQAVVRQVEELGGHWELVLGGLLFICIPPGLEFDPTDWVVAS